MRSEAWHVVLQREPLLYFCFLVVLKKKSKKVWEACVDGTV